MENQSDLFVEFLRTNYLISVSGLEKQLKIPEGTIKQPMMGKRKIPEKYWYDLYKALTQYGFEYPQIEDSEH